MTIDSSLLAGVGEAYNASATQYDRWPWQTLWRQREFPIVLNTLARRFVHPALLDLGCGTGAFAEALLGRVSRFVGIDASRRMIEAAQNRRLANSRFEEGDMLQFPNTSEQFDAVVSLRAASHCREASRLISRARASLRPGGLLILSDVAPEHRYTATRIPTLSGKRSVPTFKHSPETLSALLQRSHGFQLDSVTELRADADFPQSQCHSIDPSGAIPFGRIYLARAV
jgi:SAM-dependent methyltransferase